MKKVTLLLILLMSLGLHTPCQQIAAVEEHLPSVKLKILQTTDLHGNMLDYNYNLKQPTVEFGLARTASLIKSERRTSPNTLLFDTGDILEGNALGEYAFKSRLLYTGKIHPVFKAMNTLNYDAATVGNHEFNYGLNFLMESLKGAAFPYINANIYIDDQKVDPTADANMFTPYLIQEKEWVDTSGVKQKVKVGVIGFITPIVAEWDKKYFHNKLIVKNITKTAEHYIPIMKEEGADIIIALAHVGMEADSGLEVKEGNSVESLSKVKGIDVILFGHTHSLYPLKPGDFVENREPAIVQAGYWGNHLGIVDLELMKNKNGWKVNKSTSSVSPIMRMKNKKKMPLSSSDPVINNVMEYDHHQIIKFKRRNGKS
ncbi:metallophosphoesterase [Cytobacillus purgationiresistens]|uniref:2',3'-cyclic-nucleotide 2'-phosphodiesterase/3'-nucleotidase n=1 Tax=Cytobacillus purgationiresistens TaxID=863449 RepID=A0ABU0AE42_9BACI|nr:metallophosphoesterase [Cytobacillus purgationiresistens]MDQ0268355.1 2',3'-cyclic-nucleotide 2'-phosphodiesterase/3'-nucleotidase [Cytobacillus purgationiresistens]